MDIQLSEDQRLEANRLWKEWEETVVITARKARTSWCSAYREEDLIQEGFLALLSAAGLLGTSGKWDPERISKNGRKATFKTYLITALFNWYRDLGSRHARDSSKLSYVSEFVDPPTQRDTSYESSDDELYQSLWKVLSPLARVVLDVKWVSIPEKIPLTRIALCLNVSYDRVLVANIEIRTKLEDLQYNMTQDKTIVGEDCLGLLFDLSTSECQSCVDQELCASVFAQSSGPLQITSVTRTPHEVSVMNDETTATGTATAPTKKDPPAPRRTMISAAFEVLIRGPISTADLIAAVQGEFPNNKGTRVHDLIHALGSKDLIDHLEPVTVTVSDGMAEDGVTPKMKEVKVKKAQLKGDALERLTQCGAVKVGPTEGSYIVLESVLRKM